MKRPYKQNITLNYWSYQDYSCHLPRANWAPHLRLPPPAPPVKKHESAGVASQSSFANLLLHATSFPSTLWGDRSMGKRSSPEYIRQDLWSLGRSPWNGTMCIYGSPSHLPSRDLDNPSQACPETCLFRESSSLPGCHTAQDSLQLQLPWVRRLLGTHHSFQLLQAPGNRMVWQGRVRSLPSWADT